MGGEIVESARARGARPLVRLTAGTVLPREAVAQLAALERLRDMARDEGLRAGVLEVLDVAATALQAAGALRAEQLRQAESQALELAVRIAERILHASVERDPQALAQLAGEVRQRMLGDARVRLVAGRQAHRVLHAAELTGPLDGVELVEAPEGEPWHLEMTSSSGRLEFGLEAQLRAVAAALGLR